MFRSSPDSAKSSAPAATVPASLPELLACLENPEVTGLNRLPTRTTFQHFPGNGANRRKAGKSSWELSLDGTWEFCLAESPAQALADWHRFSDWDTQQVPGHWVLQGHGRPHYTNTQLPHEGEPPATPVQNPTGVYRRAFEVPGRWDGLRQVLRFGSVDSALILFVNGEFVGLSKDSRLPAEFDVSAVTRPGENEVVAIVPQWSDSTYIEDQDMWWLPGIARSVMLYATPQVHLADIRVDGHLESDGSGKLALQVNVGPLAEQARNPEVEVRLYDPAGRALLRQPLSSTIEMRNLRVIVGRGSAHFEHHLAASRVSPWTPETPALYTVVVTLKAAGGETSHAVIRTGFRRVEIKGRDFLLNGHRLLFTGVNRHEAHPSRGRALTEADMVADIRLMKRHHINAVRTAHYPPHERWLELCDEYGLLVVDEANIEAHHHHNQVCDSPRYLNAFVDRVARMVRRDRNHPSIVFWSLGNESGYGSNHAAAAGWVRHADPSRPLFYEGAISVKQSRLTFAHGSESTDVICPMYTDIADLRRWADYVESTSSESTAWSPAEVLREVEQLNPALTSPVPRPLPRGSADPRQRPVILCEYSHAMGNSNGSLADYFEVFHEVPGMQGGFVWEWCDQALWQTLPDGRRRLAYGGDFGETPHDANFCCDGLVSSEREPRPGLLEHRRLAQPVRITAREAEKGRLRLHNAHQALDLSYLKGEYEWTVDGEVVARGALKLPALSPGQSGAINVPTVTANQRRRGEVALTLMLRRRAACPWAPAGDVVAEAQFVLPAASPARTSAPARPAILSRQAPGRIEGEGWTAEIDPDTGQWRRWVHARRGDLLAAEPRTCLWRAATDNDGIKRWDGQEHKALGRWCEGGVDRLQRRVDAVKLRRAADGVVLTRHVSLSGRERWTDFRVREDICFAATHVDLSLDLRIGDPILVDLPRIGWELALAAGFERVQWYGLGPHENHVDRQAAARLGRWRSTVAGLGVDYVMPQQNGHREQVRWLELIGPRGTKIRCAAMAEPFGFTASHYRVNDLYGAMHWDELVPRPETVLHLDGFHRGVGTGSCGPDTLEQYRWSRRRAKFAVRLEVLP